MQRRLLCIKGLLAILSTLTYGLSSAAAETSKVLQQSERLIEQKRYNEALAVLEKAKETETDKLDIALRMARIKSWMSAYAEAEQDLKQLERHYPGNPDIMLSRAYLYYYQGKHQEAEKLFNRILSAHPNYQDAKEGLIKVKAALNSDEGYRWRMDTGIEYASISRQDQPDWQQQFVQIMQRLPQYGTSLHARIERYDQFNNIDSAYQLGIDQRFSSHLYGYLYASVSPEASFRPEFAFMGGGTLRLDHADRASPSLWLTLDATNAHYQAGDVQTFNPGFRFNMNTIWALSPKMILSHNAEGDIDTGGLLRLDGAISPALAFDAGVAYAPETVAGVTVLTKSLFGGVTLPVSPSQTLYVHYTHDDREHAYVRDAINVSFSYRF